MRVKKLIELLVKEDPEAEVEVEIDGHGDRAVVDRLEPVSHTHLENKWVVLHCDRLI